MRVLVLSLMALLTACQPQTRPPLTHDAYVWQRAWREPLKAALNESAGEVRAWHVLAGEFDSAGHLQPIAVDLGALELTHRPVILVLRINGPVLPKYQLESDIISLVREWQRVIPVAGIEIDFDSGASGLDDYAVFLSRLRAAMAQQLPLSITLLPDWLDAAEFPKLLDSVDEVVLQLHALPRWGTQLFDPIRAKAWAQRMSHYAKPFRVGLPNYGSRVSVDAQGKILAVESEVPMQLPQGNIQEVFVAPELVADYLLALEKNPLPNLLGVVWFRLPLGSDSRVWSRSTWHAVMRHQALQPVWQAHWQASNSPGAPGQLRLTNQGKTDAVFPEKLVTNLDCHNSSEQPYVLESSATGGVASIFVRSRKGLLRAGQTLLVASAHCSHPGLNALIRIED
jgi:hypothetical protein